MTVTRIMKPAKLKKPMKPLIPDVRPTLTEEKVSFAKTLQVDEQIEVPLLKAMADLPDDVNIDDIRLGIACVDDFGNPTANFRLFISKQIKNPAYDTAMAEYKKNLAKYEETLKAYEAGDPSYNLRVELYGLVKEFIGARAKQKDSPTVKRKAKITKMRAGIVALCKKLDIKAKPEELEVT